MDDLIDDKEALLPFLTLTEAETVSLQYIRSLCAALYEAARERAHGHSYAVDLEEWRAARIIEALVREKYRSSLVREKEKPNG